MIAVGVEAVTGLIAGSVVAVTLAAFKLIERITDKTRNGNGKEANLSPDVKAAIFNSDRNVQGLVKQHAPEGGVERWKWPDELTSLIRGVAETQRSQVKLMEVWSISLDKHRDREEMMLSEIRDAIQGLLKELR